MAFVNEYVPEDQKDKFDPEVFNLGPAFPPARPYCWTIDRERDVFLILAGSTGGGGQGDGYIPPKFYTLSIRGKLVKFDVRSQVVGDSKNNDAIVTYEVFNIRLPEKNITQEINLHTLIMEALSTEAIALLRNPNGLLRADILFVNK